MPVKVRQIEIDKFSIVSLPITPQYCRNMADKVRWFAWKSGYLPTINPRDKVEDYPQMDRYTIIHVLEEGGY